MTSAYESRIDRQIREAQERGDFDDLPGAGKPLPGFGEQYDENWWLKEFVKRENITGALPASLALRREIEDVREKVGRMTMESDVRAYVAGLNDRISQAQRGHLDGPPVILSTLDEDEVVMAWRGRRGGRR